jgi:galactokinase
VGEIDRVRAGVEWLQRGDAGGFGALMYASHESSRVNFENSTPALDLLVRLAAETHGVYGARLTGGGFGGSVVVLAEAGQAHAAAATLADRYLKETGSPCATCLCQADDGAR